jgi:hypothetical protein
MFLCRKRGEECGWCAEDEEKKVVVVQRRKKMVVVSKRRRKEWGLRGEGEGNEHDVLVSFKGEKEL